MDSTGSAQPSMARADHSLQSAPIRSYLVLIDLLQVTIAPYDPISRLTGPNRTYTVPVPGNRIKFTELDPETIYNITVQAGTSIGYGEVLWGAYSTLAPGQQHILRLKSRTPTSLTVQWDSVWGTSHSGYTVRRSNPIESITVSFADHCSPSALSQS
jgi:hypothetical protein